MADNVPLFMRRNALRLQKLVNTLLEFSRVQAGRAHASFAAVDLTALTSDLASSVRSAILVRDLVLMHGGRIDVASELGSGSVFTVAIPLGCAHLPPAQVDADTPRAAPSVPDMIGAVFERFTQARQALIRSQGGLGLGLAIARSMMALHGGSVQGYSAGIGCGSTFTVRMPLWHGMEEAPAPSGAAVPAASRPAGYRPAGHGRL